MKDQDFGRFLLELLCAVFAVGVVAAVFFSAQPKKEEIGKIYLAGDEISVSIANTPELRERGLSGRKSLDPNEGMLFVFQRPGSYGFWMKDMLFPIDIIWFDENRTVVDVWENATPDSYPKTHTPKHLSQFVLEVSAGYISEHDIKVGNMFEIL